jgi:hypothetical protein
MGAAPKTVQPSSTTEFKMIDPSELQIPQTKPVAPISIGDADAAGAFLPRSQEQVSKFASDAPKRAADVVRASTDAALNWGDKVRATVDVAAADEARLYNPDAPKITYDEALAEERKQTRQTEENLGGELGYAAAGVPGMIIAGRTLQPVAEGIAAGLPWLPRALPARAAAGVEAATVENSIPRVAAANAIVGAGTTAAALTGQSDSTRNCEPGACTSDRRKHPCIDAETSEMTQADGALAELLDATFHGALQSQADEVPGTAGALVRGLRAQLAGLHDQME